MSILYMPREAIQLQPLHVDGTELEAYLDKRTSNVYLFVPDRNEAPPHERPPGIIANCHRWAWPRFVIYDEVLFMRSRSVPDWKRELSDAISLAVRPLLNSGEGGQGWCKE
ncbi:hypothetical protein [Salininema proteolyticum]|uniref:Uncharacterized protein n=1 Tax=Salininema proteolyticum TaxID=1607685 RepID=A0ABV8U3P9_9ACTN